MPIPAAAEGRRVVRKLIEKHQRAVLKLSLDETRIMLPVVEQAKNELTKQLAKWIETRADGELRWTAQSYRNALVQIEAGRKLLARRMGERLDSSTEQAQALSISHLVDQVALFSRVFEGAQRSVSLNASKLIATGKSYLIPRIHTSAMRYAGNYAKDIQQRLAVDILKGSPVYETIQRLVADGGPRGLVALKGVAGEKGSVVELIPEGLFQRYRFWAERVVRTETSSAYCKQSSDALKDAARQIPDLQRKWIADGSACSQICAPMTDQVVGIHEEFDSPIGTVPDPPAHPNCGCTAVPWKDDWPSILGSLID